MLPHPRRGLGVSLTPILASRALVTDQENEGPILEADQLVCGIGASRAFARAAVRIG